MLAPTGTGGKWCPMHRIGGSRRAGDMERTSLKVRTPAGGRG